MKQSLEKLHGVFRLSDSTQEYLQVLLKEFTLRKRGSGKVIELNISDNDLCIRRSRSKKVVHEWIEKQNVEQNDCYKKQLKRFDRDENLLAYRFQCSSFPFRHANGGVLPIIRLEENEYFCLFYRDIDPVGWNIANGGSGNLDELLQPQKVLFREFSEELIVTYEKNEHLFQFDSFEEGLKYGLEKEALQAWSKRLGIDYEQYERLPIPIKWVSGPDKMIVTYHQQKYVSDGCFLNITPDDHAIELDKVAYINLRDVTLLDGELTHRHSEKGTSYKLFNRVIGLFAVDRFFEDVKPPFFIPDIVFFDGNQEHPDDLDRLITRYLNEVNEIRLDEEIQLREGDSCPKGLCPITKSLISKYVKWASEEKRISDVVHRYEHEMKQADPERYKVFISYKSVDKQIGEALYQFLTEETDFDHSAVFFSGESIQRVGESDYAKLIDKALENASSLIVIGSRHDYFDSGWVGYEWRSFLNEIKSGRKKGQIYTFTDGVSVDQLPYALRSR